MESEVRLGGQRRGRHPRVFVQEHFHIQSGEERPWTDRRRGHHDCASADFGHGADDKRGSAGDAVPGQQRDQRGFPANAEHHLEGPCDGPPLRWPPDRLSGRDVRSGRSLRGVRQRRVQRHPASERHFLQILTARRSKWRSHFRFHYLRDVEHFRGTERTWAASLFCAARRTSAIWVAC